MDEDVFTIGPTLGLRRVEPERNAARFSERAHCAAHALQT
jgi:hypothetical protein